MRGLNKGGVLLALITGMLLLAGGVWAEGAQGLQTPIISWQTPDSAAEVRMQTTAEGAFLFLPGCANPSRLSLSFSSQELILGGEGSASLTVASGEPFSLSALFPQGPDDEGIYRLMLNPGQSDEAFLNIMFSANQAALWVISDDPESAGRAYVDSAPSGIKYRASGDMLMLDENGDALYDGVLREIRSRGNTTWDWGVKKPYQIKLDKKTDLLQNGINNRARTWILLAESFDSTLLHNTLSLSLGKALGLEATPEFRPVDLYYDGEYRGYYLLCEKVQVAPGRLNIMDYSDYLAGLYPDIENREAYPLEQAENAYGNTYQYTANVNSDIATRGAYLVELDAYNYTREASWFSIRGSAAFAVKSPEYAPQADVEYLSCLMQELVDAVMNGGVNPDTGRPLSDYLDYDSTARLLLVNAFAKTCDFGYTSTYFHIPLGATKFYAGPLWDFDIAYGIRNNRMYETGVENYIPADDWLRAILNVPDFQAVMSRIFAEEFEPLISQLLLNPNAAPQGSLRPLDDYLARISASRQMNYKLWAYGGGYKNIDGDTLYPTYEENIAFFRAYLTGRINWLKQDMALWSGSTVGRVGLKLSYINAKVAESSTIVPANVFPHYTVADIVWQEEPDEAMPWRHTYTADISLNANTGVSFDKAMTAEVNGCAAEVIEVQGSRCTLRFRFSAPFYEEAVYDDVDYGLLYQYDYYVSQYPELLDEYGDDREAMLENYVIYDLPMEVSAIETFDYAKYYERYTRLLENYFTSDVMMSTLFYMDNDQVDLMMGLGEPVFPEGL